VKFVISDLEDYNYAKIFLKKLNANKNPILFSPVPERLAPELLANWILRDKLNVRLQLQLHKYIWVQGENTNKRDE
jgi:7-carboxy-7-deazaguanine synthase